MSDEKTFLAVDSIKSGDVINNGSYDILLVEDPHYNEAMGRWACKGRRWLTSRRVWQDRVETYGWTLARAPKHTPK